jgi:hypothetical protein
VQVEYELPAELTPLSITGTGWTCDLPTLTCVKAGTVAPGARAATVTVVAVVSAGAPERLQSTVRASAGGAVPVVAVAPVVTAPAFGAAQFTTSVVDQAGDDETRAGATPFTATASFGPMATFRSGSGLSELIDTTRDVVTELPPGFVGNPQAVAECPSLELVASDGCPVASIVGIVRLLLSSPASTGVAFPIEPGRQPVYNLKPTSGYPAAFAIKVGTIPVRLNASVRTDSDFGVTISTVSPSAPPLANAEFTFCGQGVKVDDGIFPPFTRTYACVGTGEPGAYERPFLANPADCTVPHPTTVLTLDSWENPDVSRHYEYASPQVTDCGTLTFEPSVAIAPTVSAPDAPTGLNVDMSFPYEDNAGGQAPPPLKKAVVTLPEGMTINPAGAHGLGACTDAELNLGSKEPVTCPDASKIGTATATTPLLDESLSGSVYIRSQNSSDPESGEMYRIALVLENKERGLSIRLPGQIRADKETGRLVATFDENPQLPVSDVELRFKEGATAPLATPQACGPKAIDTELDSWGGQTAHRSSTFTVDCAAGLGRFSPSFEAGAAAPTAGASSPLVIKVGRNDGEGELRSIDFTLPPGETGRLAGVPYCPEAAIAAAAGRSGKEEQESPSCPAASRIGSVDTAAGAGSSPFHVPGTVYLAGPYKGAPISAVVVTPAVAGPFDLGTVVVRAPLFVNPETTQITAKSDPIPTILGGVPLRLRSVAITIDRPGFSVNPTNCEPMAVGATLTSAGGATANPSNRFQVGGCKDLAFGPRLSLRVLGKTNRGAKPRLKAVVTTSPGEANIRRAQVNLPHSEFLEQDHIRTVCTRVQWNEGAGNGSACPEGSIYGRAVAWTPLLDHPLEGYVYLRSNGGERKLPDLVAGLNGQVSIALWGKVDSGPNHGIRNTFEVVPDAPVSRFVLEMNGGKKGLLVNSEDLCEAPKVKRRAIARFTGQNGKVHAFKPLVQNECGKAKKSTKKNAGHARTR